jgi:hypothetical protein
MKGNFELAGATSPGTFAEHAFADCMRGEIRACAAPELVSRSPSYETHQGWCECAPFCSRQVGPLARGAHLDAHVVGAGVEVRLDASGDGLLVAPGHHGIDEPVAAPVGEFLLDEAVGST